MAEWQSSDAISVAPQHRFTVRMECADGRVVSITLMAGTIESVIDQVRHRRIATPPGMVAYTVSEAESA
jgi:hypothetical protein